MDKNLREVTAMRKAGSAARTVSTILIAFLALATAGLLTLGGFIAGNYNTMVYDVERIQAEGEISKCIEQSTTGGISVRESIKDVLCDDMLAVSFGEHFIIDDVEFLIESSKCVVRNPLAAASVDVAIRNNSQIPIAVPLQGGWEALCAEGNQLLYTYDPYGDECHDYLKEQDGIVEAGETYRITLVFTDQEGRTADAMALSAQLSRPLEGYNRIYWFIDNTQMAQSLEQYPLLAMK